MPGWGAGLLVALGTALGLVPLLRLLALRGGWIDRPASHKAHARPVALLGGVGVYVAFMLGMLASGGLAGMARQGALLSGATLLMGVGLWDDRSPLSARTKLLATTVAALVLFGGGTRWPLVGSESLAAVLSILWVVGMSNAFNLLDHMDGVAAGVGAIAALGFGLHALGAGDTAVVATAAALAGACGGFLIYNLPPARIFLGDAGSLWLGFMLAALSLQTIPPSAGGAVVVLLPPLGLIVPLLDTLLVTVSRLRQGRNPMTAPGTDHAGHRLVRGGAGSYGTLAILYTIAIAGAVAARWVSR